VIRLIAAVDTARGIATSTGIPWRLPGDSAYFREQTKQGLIVMGSATYTEFAAPLHGRTNYVLTSRKGPLREGFEPVAGLDDLPPGDTWVIGGATVYAATVGRADDLYLTQVLADFHCTKFFPAYEDDFERTARSDEREEGGVAYRFEVWRRRRVR